MQQTTRIIRNKFINKTIREEESNTTARNASRSRRRRQASASSLVRVHILQRRGQVPCFGGKRRSNGDEGRGQCLAASPRPVRCPFDRHRQNTLSLQPPENEEKEYLGASILCQTPNLELRAYCVYLCHSLDQ